jgi:hypothetical protein
MSELSSSRSATDQSLSSSSTTAVAATVNALLIDIGATPRATIGSDDDGKGDKESKASNSSAACSAGSAGAGGAGGAATSGGASASASGAGGTGIGDMPSLSSKAVPTAVPLAVYSKSKLYTVYLPLIDVNLTLKIATAIIYIGGSVGEEKRTGRYELQRGCMIKCNGGTGANPINYEV